MSSLAPFEAALTRLSRSLAPASFATVLDHLVRSLKAGYDPNQPRDERGRWANGDGPSKEPPEVPQQRPADADKRNGVIKAVARWLSRFGGPIGRLIGAAQWLYEYDDYIKASLDPPASLGELQQAVSTPQRGYDIHHIVEQTAAERDGYPRMLIDDKDNLVRIPTLKHREITAWYQTKNKEFGLVSPREYLRGKTWEERKRIGLDALIDHGVLQQ